ncbi:MAG: hypothetical protein EXR79_10995 [Myxococcales bacterium]|nr:hypothetical protein [Myxococcales bacterium]
MAAIAACPATAHAEVPAGPFAGTSVALRHSASAVTFAKDAEPTWNPTWVGAVAATLHYALGPHWFGRAGGGVAREITDADWTTARGEWTLTDTTIAFGGRPWHSEALGVDVRLDGQFALPTSKASIARTLRFAPSLGLQVAWEHGPFEVGVAARAVAPLYRYTTASTATPWVSACAVDLPGCGRYSHTGVRNPVWRFQNALSLGWAPVDSLALSASAGAVHDVLPPLATAHTDAGDVVPPDPSDPNLRVTALYTVALAWTAAPALTVSLGAETASNALRPDSTPQAPFFNRYTALYLEMSVRPDKLWR